jgi:hypothetical protein
VSGETGGPTGDTGSGGLPSGGVADDYGPRDLLTNPKVLVDSVAPMVVFVTVNTLAGLASAALASLSLAGLVVVIRLLRRERLLYGLGGLAGTGIAVGTAWWSRSAGGFFAPGMALNVGYGVGALVSIVVGRPFVALTSWALYRWPWAWYRHERVLPAYREITVPWALLFGVRAWVRFRIITGDGVGLGDTALVLLTGWPAFAALLVATYAYVTWRLRVQDAPPVEQFREPPSADLEE